MSRPKTKKKESFDFDYQAARNTLEEAFVLAEEAASQEEPPTASEAVVSALDVLFGSQSQSFREAVIGWCLVRLAKPALDLRYPYMKQGTNAYHGREIDQKVVNPFLQDHMVPCSTGPYLAMFRRDFTFTEERRDGVRDKTGYDALLQIREALQAATPEGIQQILLYLLYRFILLRNAADIPLSRISRLSIEQYQALLNRLLQVQSGGLIPVLLAVAMLRAIKACYQLQWDIGWQGINVADKSSGAGGDITVTQDGDVILAVEVTERPIEKARVVSTFNTKIVRSGIEDYLFIYSSALPTDDARQAARIYFNQGHEINFLQVVDWIVNNLGTIGSKCRMIFTQEILALFNNRDVPAKIKVAWNDIVREIVGL